jgi:predicted nucleotidyltransferase component of viral defense system
MKSRVIYDTSKRYSGDSDIVTYSINELIGTKLRALYQRKKGRDLFDIYAAIKSGLMDVSATIECYRQYMTFLNLAIPTATEYARNLESKLSDPGFRLDIEPFLAPGNDYNIDEAHQLVREHFISAM